MHMVTVQYSGNEIYCVSHVQFLTNINKLIKNDTHINIYRLIVQRH